jgi:hypothetical protein
MGMKPIGIAALSFLLFAVAACRDTASEKTVPENTASRSTCNRACLEGYIDKYLDAMLAHDPDQALFTDDFVFTENGVRLPLGNEGLWASMVGKGSYKFYVPDVETQQVAYIGTAREETADPERGNPVTIALRLKIRNGRIAEAEQLVIRPESNLFDPDRKAAPSAAERIEKMGGPHPVFLEALPPEDRPSREKMIEIANMYFSGLQRNDGQGIYPFSDDCDRYENGSRATNVPLQLGQKKPDPLSETVYSSAWGCKEQFQSGLMHFVSRIRDRRFVAVDRERGIVFTFNFFDHGAGETRHFKTPDGREVVAGPTEPWTWQQAELFKIQGGNIRRIEAVLHRCPYGMNSGWSTYEQGLSEEIQDIR